LIYTHASFIYGSSKNSKKDEPKKLKEKTQSSQSFVFIYFVFLSEKFLAYFMLKINFKNCHLLFPNDS